MNKNTRYFLIFSIALLVLIFFVTSKVRENLQGFNFLPSLENLAAVSGNIVTKTPYILFNGDQVPVSDPSCTQNAIQSSETGIDSSTGLTLTPDTWHAPLFKVLCGSHPRINFGQYDNFTFKIRGVTSTVDPVSVSFYTFAGPNGYVLSNVVAINQFIQMGSVGTDWREVVIPMSIFKTSSWDISNVDALSFSVSPSNSIYYVDDIIFRSNIQQTIPTPAGQPDAPVIPPIIIVPVVPTPTPTPSTVTVNQWSGPSSVSVVAGQPFSFTLNWNATGPMTDSWSVFVHLVRLSDGYEVGGGDFRPSPQTNDVRWTGNIQTQRTYTIPLGTPPGEYKVMVGLYEGQPRLMNLIAGTSVVRDSQYRYNVGKVTITAPVVIVLPTIIPPTVSLVDFTKQLKIWTGESGSERSVPIANGSILNGGANTGSYSFNAIPGQYNSASLSLASLPTVYRKSLSGYDFVDMMVKVIPNPGTTLPAHPTGRFLIYAWPDTSASIPLEDYVLGGSALDSSYRMIRIPVKVLKVSNGFDLSSMEYLWFSATPGTILTYSFVIDDIYAVKTTPNDVVNLQSISSKVLKLSIKNKYDMNGVLDVSNYILTSTNDPNYSTGRSPVQIGREYHVNGFEGSTGGSYGLANAPIIDSSLYLVFNSPLLDTQRYVLTVKNVPDLFGNNFVVPKVLPFVYLDSSITGTVQVNQVGYLPISSKFAYIGNYLGDIGTLGGIPSVCRLLNVSTGLLVGEFAVTHRANDSSRSGNDVYGCDFSSITTPGTYYIYVPSFGRSYPFVIGSAIYANVSRKLMNFYYNARADVPIVYGQWSRPAGTLSSDRAVTLHSIDYVSSSDNPLAVSQTDYPLGMKFDMTGGWYDAGDYGKYVLPASGPVNELLLAYELYPQKFSDGQADIPEKNNGIPDILDEVKYEVDWFQKMQAKDGGVFDRVTAQQWESSPYDIRARYLSPESTHTTAVYAAVLAQASRVFKANAAFEAAYPGYADALLVKARKAWTFLSSHLTPLPANGIDVSKLGIGGGDYQDVAQSNCETGQIPGSNCPYSDVDNRAWAAAELYKTTGDGMYSNAFILYWSKTSPFYNMYNNFVYHNGQASFAYVTTKKYPTDPIIVASINNAYRSVADEEYGYTMNNPYRVGYRMDVPSYIGWGQFAHSASRSFHLIIAYILLGDAKYLDAAKINFDVELGANPQNQSYITGVGSNPPKNPLHLTSIWLRQNSSATRPVPGIPVFGPNYHASDGNGFGNAVQSDVNVYPSIQQGNYPILRRYFDVSGVVEQSEFGIGSIAPILAAFTYFSN